MMIINEKVFAYTNINNDLTFLNMVNFVNSIDECDIIYINGYNVCHTINENNISLILKLEKPIIIDHSYELIEYCILNKLSKFDNLSNVKYYCIPRQSDYQSDLINNLRNKGLNIVSTQYFIDYSHHYKPIISENLPTKIFTLLTGKTRPPRTLLISLLSYYGLLDYGYVSFFGEVATDQNFDNSKINDLYTKSALIKNDSLREKSQIGLEKLKLPLTLDEKILNAKVSHSRNFNADYYLACNFVIVIETSLNNPEVFFVSEKTIKPILLNKKIIVLSNKNFIKNLKNYYSTKFNKDISHLTDWCDVSYDDEDDLTTRIEMIIEEIKKQIRKYV